MQTNLIGHKGPGLGAGSHAICCCWWLGGLCDTWPLRRLLARMGATGGLSQMKAASVLPYVPAHANVARTRLSHNGWLGGFCAPLMPWLLAHVGASGRPSKTEAAIVLPLVPARNCLVARLGWSHDCRYVQTWHYWHVASRYKPTHRNKRLWVGSSILQTLCHSG